MRAAGNVPIWQIPLDRSPRIELANVGIHGNRERARTYLLHHHWCIHWYDYPGEIQIGDWVGEIRPGVVSVVPPGQILIHRWSRRDSRHAFAHFSVDEKSRVRQAIPAWSFSAEGSLRVLMEEVGSGFAVRPSRATAALWQVLWQLAGPQPAAAPPDTVSAIQRFIEQHLEKPVSLQAIAREFDLSANHANRLFKNATGSTIGAYWRKRRMELACGLLHQTSMRVKEVALRCGYQDLQQFNKLVRLHAGLPPREIRSNAMRRSGKGPQH